MDVNGSAVRCGSLLHAAYHFLVLVAVVDVRCYHLFVGIVHMGNVKWVESEGGGVVWEVREPWVFVVIEFGLPLIVNGFFDYLDSGGGGHQVFEHGYEAIGGHGADSVCRWDHDWGWCSDVNWG